MDRQNLISGLRLRAMDNPSQSVYSHSLSVTRLAISCDRVHKLIRLLNIIVDQQLKEQLDIDAPTKVSTVTLPLFPCESRSCAIESTLYHWPEYE